MNANSSFDSSDLRLECLRRDIKANIAHNRRSGTIEAAADQYFDDELYHQRMAIERTNAWLDGSKTLLVRYESHIDGWLAFHFLAFAVLLLRKIPPD